MRGTERLLWDCATVGRTADPAHIPARVRLEAELGENMAHVVLLTLREAEPSTPDEERLRPAATDVA